MSLMLFVIVLVSSFIVVRIGAIAFQLTGMEWSLAKFQSLSCFSGTGFTTREAELITGNPRRRRIATFLMVLGNAGLVTLIATVASALNPERAVWDTISESILPFSMPFFLVPWINLLIIILAIYVTYRIFVNRKILRLLTNFLRSRIITRRFFKPVVHEHLQVITDGYGVSKVNILRDGGLVDKALKELDFAEKDIKVLAVIKPEVTLFNPSQEVILKPKDEVILFGRMDDIERAVKN